MQNFKTSQHVDSQKRGIIEFARKFRLNVEAARKSADLYLDKERNTEGLECDLRGVIDAWEAKQLGRLAEANYESATDQTTTSHV